MAAADRAALQVTTGLRCCFSVAIRVVNVLKTKHGEAVFSSYVAHIWNELPKDLRLETILTTFKSKLKNYLFAVALNYVSELHCLI